MSFWDSVKKFTQPYADDDYDEYEDDEEVVDDYDEEPEATSRYSRRGSAADTAEQEDSGFGFDVGSAFGSPATTSAAAPASGGFTGQVVNMNTSKQQVVLFRPVTFDDSAKAANDLRNKKAVIVNMENVDKAMARRVVDFLSGCVFVMDGKVKKVAQSTYLFCPHNVDVTGDLENLQSEVESYI